MATVHNNIGNVLRQQGRLEEAMVEYQKALRSYRAALGNDHPWCVPEVGNMRPTDRCSSSPRVAFYGSSIATVLINIAHIKVHEGQYESALKDYIHARAIRERQLGVNHADTATLYTHLAILYGKLVRALSRQLSNLVPA